jgi:hypothetical protein
MLDGELSDQQRVELCRLMHEDPAARKQYLRQATTLAMLKWSYGLPEAGGNSPTAQDDEVGRCAKATDELPSKMSLPSHFSSVMAGTLAWFSSGGVLLTYVIVAVALGIGVAATWVWHAGESSQVATAVAVPTAAPLPSQKVGAGGNAAGPKTPVGQITRTVNCRWTNMMFTKETPAKDRLVVSLGARYIVDAGLLEITYYSGAKVVLDGPAEYEVDGSNGGFLRVGAARFFCKRPTDEKGPRAASPASKPADQQFFCVHVPRTDVPDRITIRLQDVNLGVLVGARGELTTCALSPATAYITPDIAGYPAPNNPSATVGVDANGRPFLIVMKRPPAAKQRPLTPNATAVSSSDPKEKKKKG